MIKFCVKKRLSESERSATNKSPISFRAHNLLASEVLRQKIEAHHAQLVSFAQFIVKRRQLTRPVSLKFEEKT